MKRVERERCVRGIVAMAAFLMPVGFGCGQGLVAGSRTEAATLSLVADQLGALQLETCVERGNRSACRRYPNPQACSSMHVVIGADAQVDARCYREEDGLLRLEPVTGAVPFVCSAAGGDGCLRCLDIFGEQVLSDCGSAAGSGGGDPGASEDDSDETAGDRVAGSQVFFGIDHDPHGEAELAETIELVLSEYAAALNDIFAGEGLDLYYEPDLDEVEDLASNPILDWIVGSLDFLDGICQFAGDAGLFDEGFDSAYCWTNMAGNPICRCAAMVAAAARLTCELVDALGEVDPRVYGALWLEMGKVIEWMLSIGSADLITLVDGAMGCSGSPLVLDLDNDGFALTSVEEGTRFDLHGHGLVRTAWVQGDDALLALDRDGSGETGTMVDAYFRFARPE